MENEVVRTQFNGMERLVKKTAEDSGVWQVVVCTSAAHSRRLNEIEKLRGENEELKTRVNGEFGGKEGLGNRAREETKETEEDKTEFLNGFDSHTPTFEDQLNSKGFGPVRRFFGGNFIKFLGWEIICAAFQSAPLSPYQEPPVCPQFRGPVSDSNNESD